jgi:hypothetical protein
MPRRAGESFSGRFTVWGGGNFNRSGIVATTFTFSGHGTGDEGTQVKWNSVDHTTSVGPVRGSSSDHQSRLQPVQLSLNDREAGRAEWRSCPACSERRDSNPQPPA